MIKIEDFIGTEFTTTKGSTLTVVGTNGLLGHSKRYKVTCSVCSKDEELFPEPFLGIKWRLKNGSVPCGCSTSPRWTKIQFKIRMKRECTLRGYEFLGFIGEWKGATTKVKLKCITCGNVWDTTDINSFLGGSSCPLCVTKALIKINSKPDDEMTVSFFKSGAFHKDTIFKRNTTRKTKLGWKTYWDMTCPICSYDKYVGAGLCSGVFTSLSTSLQQGQRACRCSNTFNWTRAQREYQIREVCQEEGLTFLAWTDKYIGGKSKFKWLCAEGHPCESTIDGFINSENRCRTCSRILNDCNCNGYYPERVDEKDYLYVMDFKVSTKVGRSFNPKDRKSGLKSRARIDFTPNILKLYTATHQTIYDTEQAILGELRERGFQYCCNFTHECFDLDCWYVLQEILEDYTRSGVLEEVQVW